METLWFFWFRLTYDSAYDSDFRFSLGRKCSYDSVSDSDYDSVANENQPLTTNVQLFIMLVSGRILSVFTHIHFV